MKRLLLAVIALLFMHAANAQCNPAFTYVVNTSGPLLGVTFTNTTAIPPGSFASFTWRFGDGGQAYTYMNNGTSHAYAAPGTYTVTLIMMDSVGSSMCMDSVSHQVTVAYSPCASSFTYTGNTNNSGTVTFAATNPTSNPNLHYFWNFGDGNYGSGSPVTHSYTANGNYSVTLTAIDSPNNCNYNITQTVVVSGTSVSCAGHTASFTYSLSGNTITATSTAPSFAGQTGHATWYFSDGYTTTGSPVTHTFASAGSYFVDLHYTWSVNGNVVCSSTDSTFVVVQGNPPSTPNVISGYVIRDSALSSYTDSFKVWLITYDSATQNLAAVDSVLTSGYIGAAYSFYGHTAGTYLTKAARYNGPTSGAGLVPTYHDSSLFWNQATNIVHSGGVTSGRHIYMRVGTITSGPGFIGGNVNLGANKGTGTAVPGIEIVLVNANNKPVQYTHTNAGGDFSFSNLPLGTYSVYPEELNYLGTPFTNVTLTAANPSQNNLIFGVTGNEIKPKSTSVKNVSGEELFSMYPNPTSGKLFINWQQATKDATVVIMDVAGHKVLQQSISISGSHSEINLSSLRDGLYFIKVETADAASTSKLLLQH